MKVGIVFFSIAVAFASSSTAQASSEKPVALWHCSDYLAVNETYRPTALGFAEAVNRAGKPEEAVLDIDGIAKVQPEILTYCEENPSIALRSALAQSSAKAKK